MNQILFFKNDNSEEDVVNNTDKIKKKTFFFKFQLFFCSIITLSVFLYYTYSLYNNNQKENISKKLVNNFNITSIYASDDYNATRTSNINFYETNENTFTVIGLIEINSININYPILSTVSDDLLKIAPCRFYGPMPNEVGNLCIAGHNYNSYKFFSKLKNLKNGDIINIYDLSRKKSTVYRLFKL